MLQELQELAVWCWAEQPDARPTFTAVVRRLQDLQQNEAGLATAGPSAKPDEVH